MTVIAPASPVDAVRDMLGGIACSQDEAVLRRKSRDFYWTSPVLKKELDACRAELVVTPRSEAEVVRIAAACARHRVNLTPRGGGTGNYGQAVPLHGGVVIDMSALDRVIAIDGDHVLTEGGIKLGALDRAARAEGLELLHFPSTKQSATVAGYYAGGSAGVGAVAHGGLREPGNLRGARIVTIEETPRILDLDTREAQAIMHSFGAVGLITRIAMPLAPARDWIGAAIGFDDFTAAVRFGNRMATEEGIAKKLLSVLSPGLVALMKPFVARIGVPGPIVLAMVAREDWPAFTSAIDAAGGSLRFQQETSRVEAERSATPIYEYSYGHASLLAQKAEPDLSYTQILCPLTAVEETVARLDRSFPGHILHHLEYMKFDGAMACAFYPKIRDADAALVDAIAASCEDAGLQSANPHVSTVEGGSGYKQLPIDLAAFKRGTDPYGLLNPGRL